MPLVTATFTTDELAMTVAGLMELRRKWSAHANECMMLGNSVKRDYAFGTIQRITDYINRVNGMVSAEQGAALLNELIGDLKKRPE